MVCRRHRVRRAKELLHGLSQNGYGIFSLYFVSLLDPPLCGPALLQILQQHVHRNSSPDSRIYLGFDLGVWVGVGAVFQRDPEVFFWPIVFWEAWGTEANNNHSLPENLWLFCLAAPAHPFNHLANKHFGIPLNILHVNYWSLKLTTGMSK